MNAAGRPWRIPPAELEQRIRQMRKAGAGHKAIAQALGYSHDRIRTLCMRWHITLRGLEHKREIDAPGDSAHELARHTAPCANVPAAPEAIPGDTPPTGSLFMTAPDWFREFLEASRWLEADEFYTCLWRAQTEAGFRQQCKIIAEREGQLIDIVADTGAKPHSTER